MATMTILPSGCWTRLTAPGACTLPSVTAPPLPKEVSRRPSDRTRTTRRGLPGGATTSLPSGCQMRAPATSVPTGPTPAANGHRALRPKGRIHTPIHVVTDQERRRRKVIRWGGIGGPGHDELAVGLLEDGERGTIALDGGGQQTSGPEGGRRGGHRGKYVPAADRVLEVCQDWTSPPWRSLRRPASRRLEGPRQWPSCYSRWGSSPSHLRQTWNLPDHQASSAPAR